MAESCLKQKLKPYYLAWMKNFLFYRKFFFYSSGNNYILVSELCQTGHVNVEELKTVELHLFAEG